ncbi:MAG: phosphate ABC transporter permease PstA [Pirellulales bacterium]
MVWITGGALAIALVMIIGLLSYIAWQGLGTFWPRPVALFHFGDDGVFLGETIDRESYRPDSQFWDAQSGELKNSLWAVSGEGQNPLIRWKLRGSDAAGNRGETWRWDAWIRDVERPEWAIVVERTEHARLYAELVGLKTSTESTDDPAVAWQRFHELQPTALAAFHRAEAIEKHDLGNINRAVKKTDLLVRKLGEDDSQVVARCAAEQEARSGAEAEILRLKSEFADQKLLVRIPNGSAADIVVQEIPLGGIVRASTPNRDGFGSQLGLYAARWWEFLSESPREANTEGGVFPCIWGTVAMTLCMSLLVAPFGVLAVLYLREYATAGPIVTMIRIAINNLAGVPSIVFGAFGLVFFCYWIGRPIDNLFFAEEKAANVAVYGKGGLLWASLTMALLTLPVVIVATEEALAAVPNSMREGSYACGASKWQTIRRIVLPRALPGIMTGLILAMARGAGEVAPLMLVGVMQTAPELPVDTVAPFVHPERGFMHLSYHIYGVGFMSANAEAAKPLVMTSALLLIMIITTLNVMAVWFRNRLRRRYASNQF